MSFPTKFYSGTSGMVMPGPQSTYPPAFQGKSRLEYYAHLLNSLEINSSFYKTPKPATVAKWGESVPDYFRFTFKLSKAVTHAKGLEYNEDDLEKFMESIAQISKNKGCLLIQFPPSVTIDKIDRVQQLLTTVEWHNERKWQLAVEFRHASWYEKEAMEILKEYKALCVMHDKPGSIPSPNFIFGKTIYIRFHGPGGSYRGSYDDAFLKEQAKQINAWRKKGKTVYCYFNNTMGAALQNLTTLNALIKS